MSQTLIQNALLAYAESQTDTAQRREATRNRLTDVGRSIALCTAQRVLGIDIELQSVIVKVIEVTAPGAATDEGHRLDNITFTVDAENGPIEFTVSDPKGFGFWSEQDATLFVRGPRNTKYSFFHIRNLADLGEFARAVLIPEEATDEQ